MPKYYGENHYGLKWISLRYLQVYGMQTKRVKEWREREVVAISTNRGLWRFNSQGYTSVFTEAQEYNFDEACEIIKDLGPEKYAKLVEFPNDVLTARLLS